MESSIFYSGSCSFKYLNVSLSVSKHVPRGPSLLDFKTKEPNIWNQLYILIEFNYGDDLNSN